MRRLVFLCAPLWVLGASWLGRPPSVAAQQPTVSLSAGPAAATVSRTSERRLFTLGLDIEQPVEHLVVQAGMSFTTVLGLSGWFLGPSRPDDQLAEGHVSLGVSRALGRGSVAALVGPSFTLAARADALDPHDRGALRVVPGLVGVVRLLAAPDDAFRVGVEVTGHVNEVLPVVSARLVVGLQLPPTPARPD